MKYYELNNETRKSFIKDFGKIGIKIRPAFIANDITTAIKSYIRRKTSISPLKDERGFFGYTSYDGLRKIMKERKISAAC